ncbi:MAG: hypothetical protein ACREBB_05015 [Nitrosotalea sp.]
MKVLYIAMITLGASFIVPDFPVLADDAIKHVTVDGTISGEGCKVINGTIMSALDIQNTPIEVCEYHNKHFKLSAYLGCSLISVGDTRDPETGQKYSFNVVCDEPTTCGLKNSWGGYNNGNVGNTDWLNASTINGTGFVITANYDEGVCLSEKYDEPKKKITIIADGLWENETVVNMLIPKVLLTSTAITIDGQKADAQIIDHNPNNETLVCPACYYTMNIHLTSSPTAKKIEIGAQNETKPDHMSLPLQQFRSGTPLEDTQCGKDLVLWMKQDHTPVCVQMQSAAALLHRGFLLQDSYEQFAIDEAKRFIRSCATFRTTGGMENTLKLTITVVEESMPPIVSIHATFDSAHPGYGNMAQSSPINHVVHHVMLITISNTNQITRAIMDKNWDELHEIHIDTSTK